VSEVGGEAGTGVDFQQDFRQVHPRQVGRDCRPQRDQTGRFI